MARTKEVGYLQVRDGEKPSAFCQFCKEEVFVDTDGIKRDKEVFRCEECNIIVLEIPVKMPKTI